MYASSQLHVLRVSHSYECPKARSIASTSTRKLATGQHQVDGLACEPVRGRSGRFAKHRTAPAPEPRRQQGVAPPFECAGRGAEAEPDASETNEKLAKGDWGSPRKDLTNRCSVHIDL